ncbi:HAD family phosphatase [Bacillus infantis]|uniref:HAD family hydrolase n=1 Tax=Bacillus infantis TaxID=324767 RepID=UPI00101CC040|nr:HAD family hydrolase [Bacillus infantis]RYI29711.1 HAD family phosphatase [Bacillus infantis]
MTAYQIIFLDIDGTILRPDDTIQESTRHAVAQAKEKGIEVFLATGRPLHEIAEIGKELNISSFIGYNGAFAVHKGKTVLDKPMARPVIEEYLQTAKEYNHQAVLYSSEQNLLTDKDAGKMKDFLAKFHLNKNALIKPEHFDQILGMTVLSLKEGEQHLYERNGIHLSQVNVDGMRECYDVIRDTVNKGYALEVVMKELGIPREASIAFGDGMNDKEMLKYAGVGIAMGNSHPDLLEYADKKTTTVSDSGIFNGLKELGIVN